MRDHMRSRRRPPPARATPHRTRPTEAQARFHENLIRIQERDGLRLRELTSLIDLRISLGLFNTGAGIQATSCCTTNVGIVNYSTTHADWIAAGTFVQPFGFDPRVAVPAHEYFHLWQIEVGCINTQIPSWMTEGMAEYLSFQAVQRRRR